MEKMIVLNWVINDFVLYRSPQFHFLLDKTTNE
jgi:hypothetical protein